ncbi:DNA-binding transcriptional regulator, XRE-family HTH domain [Oscillospiraceae bacterium]|nr:DNA-binding transcriptional regulator, XRE-family HTH domain [Oscillospiraceae bacterium]
MNREEFIAIVNKDLKLVRTEYGLTQDKMAIILGISKKTLVESEKGRRSIGWTEAVALVTIFSESTILQNSFGDDLQGVVSALAFENVEINYPSTMGGRVWWKEITNKDGYRIQQNIISAHYRILDSKDRRLISSFSLDEIREYLDTITK